MTKSLALLMMAALAATATASCLHSLDLTEVTYSEVFDYLDGENRDCFSLTPSNEGFLFQLSQNINYTSGVKFDVCDELGGCRCQHFSQCDSSEEADECDCFTPYACTDEEGLYRCFTPTTCNTTASRTAVDIYFNKFCVPTSSNSDRGCEELFEERFAASLATCVRSCRFDGDVFVIDHRRVRVDVRMSGDVDDIVDCINNQFVGVNDCFAIAGVEYTPTTTTTTTTTTSTTTSTTTTPFASSSSLVTSTTAPLEGEPSSTPFIPF